MNRYKPSRENLWWLDYYYREIRPQSQQRVAVAKPDGVERVYDIASRVREITVIQTDDLIDEVIAAMEQRDEPHRTAALGTDILIWEMRGFGEKRHVEQVIRRARNFKTLIVDLRGNPGGRVDTLNALVGRRSRASARTSACCPRRRTLPPGGIRSSRTPLRSRAEA